MIPWFAPAPIPLGPFKIEWFGILAAAGVYTAMALLVREARRHRLDPRPMADFAVWGVAGGVVGGHLVHVLAYHPEELTGPLALLKVWDGLSSMGGLLGGLAAALVFFRVKRLSLAPYKDVFALALPAGWGVARVGCFLVHDHPGLRSDSVFAVAYPEGPRWDLGLCDAVMLFALAALLNVLDRLGVLRGRLLPLLATLYGVQRFLFDFLRATDTAYHDARYAGLTPAQFVCLGLMAWGVWGLAHRPAPAPSQAPGHA
jgi:phosphatidylglycerol:prolipoprotein diacylglycerol transferase